MQSYENQGQINTFEIISNDRNHLVKSMLVRELLFFFFLLGVLLLLEMHTMSILSGNWEHLTLFLSTLDALIPNNKN